MSAFGMEGMTLGERFIRFNNRVTQSLILEMNCRDARSETSTILIDANFRAAEKAHWVVTRLREVGNHKHT